LENVMKGLRKSLPERYHHMLPMNEEALMIGSSIVHEIKVEPAHH
jgi:2-oxoglutarate ferredoxin oxidoreductase subunit gamma